MKTYTFAIFIVMALVQWYVPVSMIRESEEALAEGDELLFLTRPVDPSDPFRGKYITLSFEEENLKVDTVPRYVRDQEIYALFTVDPAGFADLVSLHEEDPGDELSWVLKVKVAGAYVYDSVQSVQLQFPFDRFYLEESKASDAEKAQWGNRLQTDVEKRTYAVVKIKGRRAVLTDVRIGNKSIVDIVREMNEPTE